ncbi:hypothetical protein VOLCADRAFT_87846 [Volvox carteri f. nagariensis]|uniref:BACK domain-containing protein n=1 Tax=Volvox carteri f. nagariensis TaxID=3068 RepID=D8TME2_VOLCA|nr:uncharacterized protein VOLCADRAFT_87846 [Volvox carteri f. nagariensis]EFJ51111.1 hypothetical protein VOLCADRAFT_87846 [Volvox carteri f. nagariensis]|eukprot:XP_002947578.1 hypothetical protein VOLCADRAFT_87846 [Volvox carteri f. nagariensis]
MKQGANRSLLDGISELFGSNQDSDCVIVFCQDTSAPAAEQAKQASSRKASPGAAQSRVAESLMFGEPLPAHRLVLRLASERFAAQLQRWSDNTIPGPTRTDQNPAWKPGKPDSSSTAGPVDSRPSLRIPLGSEDELPSARAAIQFAYTGEVSTTTSSVREILGVRRQAGYLQISGCAAACDEALRKKIGTDHHITKGAAAAATAAVTVQRQEQHRAMLELLECQDLWPDLEVEPTFAAILRCVRPHLVCSFRDAPTVLNNSSLKQHFLELPAVALVELLSSSDFGTDSESTILLLLAVWMERNYDRTDAKTRERLCRAVRLGHLSRPYLSLVLPALAADYERLGPSQEAWFPLNIMEAAFVSNFASTPENERVRLLPHRLLRDDRWMLSSLAARPRRKCITESWSPNATFRWHIKMQDLQDAVRRMDGGRTECVYVTFDMHHHHHHQHHHHQQDYLVGLGFHWSVGIQLIDLKSGSAMVCLFCSLPPTLAPIGSRLSEEEAGDLLPAVVPISALLVVHSPNSRGEFRAVFDAVERIRALTSELSAAIRAALCLSLDVCGFTLHQLGDLPTYLLLLLLLLASMSLICVDYRPFMQR